jgi:hypothetical protein
MTTRRGQSPVVIPGGRGMEVRPGQLYESMSQQGLLVCNSQLCPPGADSVSISWTSVSTEQGTPWQLPRKLLLDTTLPQHHPLNIIFGPNRPL